MIERIWEIIGMIIFYGGIILTIGMIVFAFATGRF